MEKKDNEIKENMCQTCRADIPLAFLNDGQYQLYSQRRNENIFSPCNLILFGIIILFLYFVFKKK